MDSMNFPRIPDRVRFLKTNGNRCYLIHQGEGLKVEVDEELFDFALYLDGHTNPASIEGVSEFAASEALNELEKYDLLEYSESLQQNGVMGRDRKCLHTENDKQHFVSQILLHPNMMTLMPIAIMVYTYFTRQTVFFLLAAALMAFVLIRLSVIDIRHKMRTGTEQDDSKDAF